MATTDPNPSTNPGLRLRCANCKGMGVNTEWDWHLPPSPFSSTGYTTEIGDRNDKDSHRPTELNARYPHCPTCGSDAVDIIKVYDPTVV